MQPRLLVHASIARSMTLGLMGALGAGFDVVFGSLGGNGGEVCDEL